MQTAMAYRTGIDRTPNSSSSSLQTNSLGFGLRDAFDDFARFEVELDRGRVPRNRAVEFAFELAFDDCWQVFENHFAVFAQNANDLFADSVVLLFADVDALFGFIGMPGQNFLLHRCCSFPFAVLLAA